MASSKESSNDEIKQATTLKLDVKPITKILTDIAVEQLSIIQAEHSITINNITKNMTTLQAELNEIQQILKLRDININTIMNEKDTLLTTAANNIRDLQQEILELKQAWTTSSTPLPTSPSSPSDPFLLGKNTSINDFNTDSNNIQSHNQYLQSTKPTTVVLPSLPLPTFSGKVTELPRQFLLRAVEYARVVNKWSTENLLQGISQFLKDTALEWYYQLYYTNTVPTTWTAFVTLFLAHFHSPIRKAQQEQDWLECKQSEDDTINEFVVRLRSLWLEQKPEETEADFIKHLFCKMRPDMLNLMSNSRTLTLTEIIFKAQKIEKIIYRRQKEIRQRMENRYKPATTTSNTGRSYNTKKRNYTISPKQNTPTCWCCYETGHYVTTRALNEYKAEMNDLINQSSSYRSKNT